MMNQNVTTALPHIVGEEIYQSPRLHGCVRHRKRGSDLAADGRLLGHDPRWVLFVTGDPCRLTTGGKTFEVVRWITGKRNKQTADRTHRLRDDAGDDLALASALCRVRWITDRVTCTTLQHTVEPRAGARAQAVMLDQGNLTPPQHQVARNPATVAPPPMTTTFGFKRREGRAV